MYNFAYSIVFLLSSLVLTNSRTIFVSQSGAKIYLASSSESDICMTPACVTAAASILKSLDSTLDPCDDFYDFVCGGWLKRNEIQAYDREINPLVTTRKELEQQLKELLESKDEISDPPFVKSIKNFYKTCTDDDTLKKQGSEPLKKLLRHLGGWPVIEGNQWDEFNFDWVDTLISFRKLGYDPEILLNLNPSFDNTNVLTLGPAVMGIGFDLTFGLEDPRISWHYKIMVKSAKLLGAEKSIAAKEMLETLRLIISILSITERTGDSLKLKPEELSIAELQKEKPNVPWLKIINGILLYKEVDEDQIISIQHRDLFFEFVDLITSTDKRVIANYMLWRAVLESKDYLSEKWKKIQQNKAYMTWDEDHEEKWRECYEAIDHYMGIGLASYYVRRYFDDEIKDQATMIMKYIHKEFLKLLEKSDWMDEKTKKKAEEKAIALKTFIGYPNELMNDTFMMEHYKTLTISSDSYLESMLSYRKWNMDLYFSIFNQSSEAYSWIYSSKFRRILYAGAFYNYKENSMAIPAGILHVSFYNKDQPKYMNFPSIGYIIGHEITHGFDNKGRRYNKDGEIVNWWDEESDNHYNEKVRCIIDQYDNYTTDIGMKVNGEKTQNENIADNGGMKEAYLAYQAWTQDNGLEQLLPGVNYNQNQLFWISSTLAHCTNYRPDALEKKILLDSHSPAKFRIIGSLSNSPEFSKDFNCPADAPMNRKYKCGVW